MEIRGFGRRVALDARDAHYPMRAYLRPTYLPKSRYYAMGKRVPMDQGKTGTCVAHAWAAFLMAAPLMCDDVQSPMDMYRQFVKDDEFPDNDRESSLPDGDLQYGTSVRAGVQYLRTRGHIKSFVWAKSADEAAAWLLTGQGTLVAGTMWYWDMGEPDARGYVHLTGGEAGGHAWNVVGYNRILKCFRGMCHWGNDYGDRGRFWIRHGDMDRLIKDQEGEMCAAVEQRLAPVAVPS